MAGATSYIGTGSTISFGSSTYTAEIVSVDWAGVNRPTVETTQMGTDTTPGSTTFGNSTHIPVSIADPGQITIEVYFNPDLTPPMVPATVADSETIQLTFPTLGEETPANWSCEGFCEDYSVNCPLEDLMTATLVIQLTLGVSKTVAST